VDPKISAEAVTNNLKHLLEFMIYFQRFTESKVKLDEIGGKEEVEIREQVPVEPT
jgi:hypothetical protein